MEKSLNIAQILGPVPGDPLSLRVKLQDGTVTSLSVTAATSAAIDVTIFEYHDVFVRLANE
jgi:hypothetical protein